MCAGMLIGIAGNVMKQNAIYPPPTDLDREPTEEESSRGEQSSLGPGIYIILSEVEAARLVSMS